MRESPPRLGNAPDGRTANRPEVRRTRVRRGRLRERRFPDKVLGVPKWSSCRNLGTILVLGNGRISGVNGGKLGGRWWYCHLLKLPRLVPNRASARCILFLGFWVLKQFDVTFLGVSK